MMNEHSIKYIMLIILMKIANCKELEMTVEYIYENSLPEDRLTLYDFNEEVINYKIISIDLPNTESSDNEISFSFMAFGKEVKLNLKKTNYFIIDSNTPVYNLTSKDNDSLVCHKIPLNINRLEGFYEDKDNSALVYISIDENGAKRIETGVIKAQNLTIQRVSNYFILPDGSMTNESKSNEYVIQNIINTPDNYSVFSDAEILNRSSSFFAVPSELSIKVLLLVDNAFLNKSKGFEGGLNATIKYLINFWSQVSMIFQNLIQPEYKIKIAGIAVDYDDQVFDFLIKHTPIEWGFSKALKYDDAFNEMSKWLQRKSLHCIPLESYSIVITHSPLLHNCYMQFNNSCAVFSKWAVVQEATACFVEQILQIPLLTKLKNVGLLFDDRFFNSIKVAANQIATMLSIFKNEDSCNKFNNTEHLVSTIRPSQNKWTDCSLKSLKAFLETHPMCLYNVST